MIIIYSVMHNSSCVPAQAGNKQATCLEGSREQSGTLVHFEIIGNVK